MQNTSQPPPPAPPPPYEDRPSAPPGWIVQWSEEYGGWYYINTVTRVSQWEAPERTTSPHLATQHVNDDAALAARLQAEEDERARLQNRPPPSQRPQQYGDYLQPGPAGQQPHSPSLGTSPVGGVGGGQYSGGYSPQTQYEEGRLPPGGYGQYSQDTNFYGQPQPQGPGNTKPGGLLGRLMSKVQGRMSNPSGTMSTAAPPPPTGMASGRPSRPNKWGVPGAAAGGAGAGLLGGVAMEALMHKFTHGGGGRYGHGYGGGGYYGGPLGYYDGPFGMYGGPVGVYSGMPGFYGGGYCSDGGFYGRAEDYSSSNSRRSSSEYGDDGHDDGGGGDGWGVDGGDNW